MLKRNNKLLEHCLSCPYLQTKKLDIIGGTSTGGNMKLDIVGGGATGGNMKLDIVGGGATGGNMKLD